jgi:hypothetical protein
MLPSQLLISGQCTFGPRNRLAKRDGDLPSIAEVSN